LDAKDLALYGGEEYELIVTVNPSGWERAQRRVQETGGSLIRIGVVTDNPSIRLRDGGTDLEIPCRGWEHFKS